MKTKILKLFENNLPNNEFKVIELKNNENCQRDGFLIYSAEEITCNNDIKKFYENYINKKTTELNLFRYYYYQKLDNNNHTGEHITFVMMNPAFANSNEDDFTIKNILKYLSDKKQYSSFDIVNLYPVRMPKGAKLDDLNKEINKYYKDINENYQNFIISYLKASNNKIVAAWGSKYHKVATTLFKNNNIKFYCYGLNKDGSPRHFSNQAFIRKDNFLNDFKEYHF